MQYQFRNPAMALSTERRIVLPTRDSSRRPGSWSRLIPGVVLGSLGVLLATCIVGLSLAGLGLFPVHADATPLAPEKVLAQWTLRRSVERNAATEPLPTTGETDLMDGLHVYYNQCIVCHSGSQPAQDVQALAFYPPPPHFSDVGTTLSEPQVRWVTRHGIRLTGMPGFKSLLTDMQIADVAAFIKHIQTLPPEVARTWNR